MSNSNYCMENVFIDMKTPSNCFSLFHVNIRSIPANLDKLEQYLNTLKFKFPIIGISETWLTDINHTLYNIDGYIFCDQYRKHKKGGGVGIFVKNNVDFFIREDLSRTEHSHIFESMFIEIVKHVFQSKNN